MSTTKGTVGVSITAGHLEATDQPLHPVVGQQFTMGGGFGLMLHITPEVARQWIQVLETVATKESGT